jgi:hypothetical protein
MIRPSFSVLCVTLALGLTLGEAFAEPAPKAGIDLSSPENFPRARVRRLGFEVLAGGLSALVVGLPSALLGCHSFKGDCGTGALLGGTLGVGIAVPAAVMIIGDALGGDGEFWATVLGDAGGLLIGAASVELGGWEAAVLLIALPLVGAVLGYESSQQRLGVTVAPTQGGGLALAMGGRF